MATYVNGERLDPDWVVRERAILDGRYREAGKSVEPARLDEDAHANAVEKLILRQRARGVVPSVPRRDVQRRLERRAEEFGGIAAFYRHLGLAPSDGERLREELREEIRYDRYVAALTEEVPAPGDDELRVIYDEQPERFRRPEVVHVAHVVMQPRPGEDSSRVVMDLMNIREALREKDTLRGVPHRMTRDGMGAGDLGYISRGSLDEAFDRVVFGLAPGEISEVFRTSLGYHIAVVYDRRPEETLSFENSRKALREEVWRARKNEHIGHCVDRFLKESVVEDREAE